MTGDAKGRVKGWDFRGREHEVAALEAAWVAAGSEDGAPVMVVHGEPGIGKTRMIAEFTRSLRARDIQVLKGAAYEGGSGRPYGVWGEAMDECVKRLGSPGLKGLLGNEARWLAPLVQDGVLAEQVPVGVPALVARARLAEVLAGLLDALPARVVVVLDDMQWADPESLELFAHVARLAPKALIVIIFRGASLELGHPLAQRLAEVQRQRSCEYLPLDSLSRRDGGQLLEQAAGMVLEIELIDALHERSGGNPFFLGELGRYLLSHGDTKTFSGDALAVPESIRAAVGLRVAGLSAETRRMLTLASVFTAGFGFAELAAMTDLDEGPLLDCVEEALTEELLHALDAERYTFAHALVRQTLYEQMSSSRRARLHRRLADVLERLHENDLTPVAGELVRQYHASATLAGAERGAIHAITAGRAARAAYAPADAVVTLRRGLDLVAAEDHDTQGRLLSELALAQADSGLFSDARETLATAVSLLERRADADARIPELVYGVGTALWVVPTEFLAIDPLIERALAALGQHRNLTWARLKLLRRYVRREALGPIPVLEWAQLDPAAVQIARDEGTETDYVNTLDGWQRSFGDDEDLIARVGGWRDPGARMQALVGIVGDLTLFQPGRAPATADRLCDELSALADDVGFAPHRTFVRVYRAAMLGGRGEFDAAAEQIRKAEQLVSPEPLAASDALIPLIRELTAQHVEADWPRVGDLMWELALSPAATFFSVGCAAFASQAHALAGDVVRARTILEHLLPLLTSNHPAQAISRDDLGFASGAVWELRAVDLAEQLLPNARSLADSGAREFYMTSTELSVARLSAVTGRVDLAGDYFARARVSLERRDQPVLRAIVDYDEALTRLEHQQPGAATLLDSARTRFDELGMREWSRRLAVLEVPDQRLPDHLTMREAEILRLVAVQRTNKEIAAELVVSVHTVERHVQNAYRKIGANSRFDATAYVSRVEL